MSKGRRFWRGTAFRAAVICGVICGLVAMVALFLTQASSDTTELIVEFQGLRQEAELVSSQLEAGVGFDELVLPSAGPMVAVGDGFESDPRAFVVVLVNGDQVISRGGVQDIVLDSVFDDLLLDFDFGDIFGQQGGEQGGEFELEVELDQVTLEQLGMTPKILDAIVEQTGLSPTAWVLAGGGEIVLADGETYFLEVGQQAPDPDVDGTDAGDFFVVTRQTLGSKIIDGQSWGVAEEFLDSSQGPVVVVSASPASGLAPSVSATVTDSVLPAALLGLLAGLAAAWLTRRALRPVEKMRSEVELISQRSLERRVPPSGSGDVVDRLAVTMNTMLERLDEANESQIAFMANASHELRSPVAGLQAQLEVAAMYPDKVDAETLLPQLHDETKRLALLVDDLLYLSRTEGSKPTYERVGVDDVVEAEVGHQQRLNPQLTITQGARCGGSVMGLELDVTRAVRNLMTNAANHADEAVVVNANVVDGYVEIVVADDGPGVPQEQVDKIFSRFVRLDEGRARDAGGAGLGLAITAEIAHRHGGTVSVLPHDGQGARFCLRIPVAAATASA